MKYAVVTGATGFIGAHLVAALVESGVSVTALCRICNPSIYRLPDNINIAFDFNELDKADVFYHLAWEHASGSGRADAAAQAKNVEFTLRAMDRAKSLSCKRFIAMGTVYERLAPQIMASKKFSGPDFYVLSKKYAHMMANRLAKKLGMEFVWCTVCHPIGPGIKRDQMMASVISKLLIGEKVSFGPAITPYDIVSVQDVAAALRLLGQSESLLRREYYIGSGSPRPLYEWLFEARDILGSKTELGLGEREDDGLLFKEKWFDISPLIKGTGYAPRVSFADAVKLTAESLTV